MALVTKQYLYETIASILAGGDPSAGKKFEPRMVQAHLQMVINRKLKTEYLSTTLPGDETIPEGLVLACYDTIPVESYKGLSRAKLPAMPVSLRRNMGVFFVGPAVDADSGQTPASTNTYVIIEGVTGGAIHVIGTDDTVTGFTADSTTITCNAFADKYVRIVRGNLPTPGIDPGDGSNFFTKAFESNIITFSNSLAPGEYLKIEGFLPIVPAIPDFIIIESRVDVNIVKQGLQDEVIGLESGSDTITCNAFANRNVEVTRGSVILPGSDPGDGSQYYTKTLESNQVILSADLVANEYIKIETL